MTKEVEIVKLLRSIDSKFDTLITLTRLSAPKQHITTREKKILELYNRKNTVSEIMKKTNKTRISVEVALSSLRSKGIIKSATLTEKDTVTGKPKVVYVKA